MGAWIKIGGEDAATIAAHTPPTWETSIDGGCLAASWSMALSAGSAPRLLSPGVPVEIMVGATRVWYGVLDEPDRLTWTVTARGIASRAADYLAIDTGNAPTRDLPTAFSRAQGLGWDVLTADTLGIASGDAAAGTLSQLFDEYAVQLGKRWSVRGDGYLRFESDATEATWLAAPQGAVFSEADDNYITHLVGQYDNGTTLAQIRRGDATATVGREEWVDLTPRGVLSSGQATDILDGLLALRGNRLAWTNGVTLTNEQLTSLGGTPAFLASVRAGQMLRAYGVANARHTHRLDVVIGKTVYTAGAKTIYIEPVALAPRNLADFVASVPA